MKILLISHYFPPEVNAPANRVFSHSRHWTRAGHQVTVITGVPNHPSGRLFRGYENRFLQRSSVDGVEVIRTWMYLTPNRGFVRRVLNYVLFAVTAVLASFRAGRPDVVVATSPQFFCGIAGWIVARLKRRPFVLEVRDLWPDSIVAVGQLRDGFVVKTLRRIERALYRSSDGVVTVTEAFAKHVRSFGVDEDRVAVVYNGIDLDDIVVEKPEKSLREELGISSGKVVAYAGTVGLAHGVSTILDLADRSRASDISFVVIGDGAELSAIRNEAERRELTNVYFTGLVDRRKLLGWLRGVDVALVLLRDLPVFRTVIPSKIFELAALEVPFILACHGESRELITSAGVATAVDPEDTEQIARAMTSLLSSEESTHDLVKRGRAWVREHFNRERLAEQYLVFLESRL